MLESPVGKLQNGSTVILTARDGAWILDQSITPVSGCMGRKYVGLDNTLESFEGTPLGSPLGSWFQSASCLHNENLFCVVSTGVQTVSAVRGMGRCFS